MQVAMMQGQSPSSTMNNGNASTPDPPVSSSIEDDNMRLRISMEEWKRNAAIAKERYNEARQRQIAVERADRQELRKRWLEEEAKKRAESVGKQKEIMSGGSIPSNMPPPLYQSTPINHRDRKRHLDSNDYGHEEWRQGFRLMEGSCMSGVSKPPTDAFCNVLYPVSNENFYPMMSEIQQQGKGIVPNFSTTSFQNGMSYSTNSYPSNDALPSSLNGHFSSSKSTPNLHGSTYSISQTAPSTMGCSSMPSTSTADSSLCRFPTMELPQFPVPSDATPNISQQSQQTHFSASESTPYCCGMRPSPSMCPTSPNEVPTPPALANTSSVPVGTACTTSSMMEQNLSSPTEDLGCNAVNEDNMTRMLTSIRTDSLGMLGADAVDSLFDDASGDCAGQVPLVTSTDSSSSPTGFSHGGPQSVHSIHSAPQSNNNCNPPSTPTASVTPSAPQSTSYPHMTTTQSNGFLQCSPHTIRPSSPPQQSSGLPAPASGQGQNSSYPPNVQQQNPAFPQQRSSQSGSSFPSASVSPATSFPMSSSAEISCYGVSALQSTNYPQQNSFTQQVPSGNGYSVTGTLPTTSNQYACASAGGMAMNSVDPAFIEQQGMMNPSLGMNGYPGYDITSAQLNQQQMAMQAHQHQQMTMGMAGASAAMNAQHYHMVMMQKHQQHMKMMMQQRAAMMYHGYPNGAQMTQQQYFLQMQKMQQARFPGGIDPPAQAFVNGQRMMSVRSAPMGVAGPMIDHVAPAGGYPGAYPQTVHPFPPQQQYVGQFPMN